MEYIQAADEGGLYWFASHHTRLGNKVMLFFSEVGDLEVSCSLVGVAILLFILAGRWRTAIVFVLAALFGLGFSQGVKYLLMRDRPDVAWKMVELPESPSFPSGHSFNSMNLYGSLALLASRHMRRRHGGNSDSRRLLRPAADDRNKPALFGRSLSQRCVCGLDRRIGVARSWPCGPISALGRSRGASLLW